MLTYDSGNGNGAFGFGWSLSLPSISRKTDKGLPRYSDATDTFLISGADDLVPMLDANGAIDDDLTFAAGYVIRRYRPRVEGLFARIERWTRSDGDVHWRSISSDNVLTIYGKDATSRVQDPLDPTRVFTWLISETRDDKGNAIVYEYKGEDGAGVDVTQAHEQGRGDARSRARGANRYIHRILYGNRRSLLDPTTHLRARDLTAARLRNVDWKFELVFDYGERAGFEPVGSETWSCRPDITAGGTWPVRPDPFSGYRAGFEVRSYRLCRRVLMLHHFPQDNAVGRDCLVRSLDFAYRDKPEDIAHCNPGFSFLERAAPRSYQRDAHDSTRYRYRSLPPLEFHYSEANIDRSVRELEVTELENLPAGLGGDYRWVDLDGEGLAGVLTEQAGAWYYKSNLGAGPSGPRFAPLRVVAPRPSLAALGTARQQLMDLSGSGQLALVELQPPLAGFYERNDVDGWSSFKAFANLPNLDWADPNLRFVDLTGDSYADALITEDEVFTWHPSESTEGFGQAERSAIARDERDGPRVVFADEELSVFLADMSGDGLSDIVRIRNGQVCYWPNLGYGRFGQQVVMDASPWFDDEDLFDRRRIRLADIDGSGSADLVYLGRDGARLWFNRSGNEWSAARELPFLTATSNVDQIQVADLLGNGTACLVWSSDLPRDARRPMRYLDLMGGTKPHLLTRMVNNLGAETEVTYAPSTKYYLQDKLAGTPWATRLPFPVQCVEKVTVRDRRRKTEFSTTYSYHHGCFDGPAEREFRGFGRVEQVDTERFDDFADANADSPYVTPDLGLFQPPVKTITWFHTGIAVDRHRILGLFEHEYFPSRFASRLWTSVERELPQPEIDDGGSPLDTDELREAMRACKGMTLRQEVYELDIDALESRHEHQIVRLYSAAQHNCHIRRLQPRGPNRHSVFLVTEGEAVTYQYELPLGGTAPLDPDPRIAHALNLRFDDYGRPRQSVAAAYPRRGRYVDDPRDPAPLSTEQLALIHEVQGEPHAAYTEHDYTRELPFGDDHWLPVPCEVRTYELTGVNAAPADHGYLTPDRLRDLRLNATLDARATQQVLSLDYQQRPRTGAPHKRLVEHAVTLYFEDDLSGPRALGLPSRLGLTYESYKLALTDSLLTDVLPSAPGEDAFAAEARAALGQAGARPGFLAGGYQRGSAVLGAQGAGQWWMRSGVAGFDGSAPDHFYLPERYVDPFGNETSLVYDGDDLFVKSSRDTVGNTTSVIRFDHRVLAPSRVEDLNDNVIAAAFDVFGLPVATAQMGKVSPGPPEASETGDTVEDFTFANLNPDPDRVAAFFLGDPFDADQARKWLGKSTARFLYHFGESTDASGRPVWGTTAAGACGIVRELHQRDAANTAAAEIPIQASVEYSDGAGQAFVKKIQAEPDPSHPAEGIRWIANGKTIVNNKGKPVLQYEPYFSDSGHHFEEPQAVGVSPILYYDAPGRLIRTEFPDGSFSRVEFSPWLSRTYDQNDTVREPGNRWYAERTAVGAETEDKRAARLAALHAGTPAETHFDSLGRSVVAIARNRSPAATGPSTATSVAYSNWPWNEERYLTFTKLDAEGKPLWICDARGNLVMQYVTPPGPDHTPLYDAVSRDYHPAYFMPPSSFPCYDVAGNLLFQHSMDAGDRRMLMDAAGQPLLAWDYNERKDATTPRLFKEHRRIRIVYDALHRPLERWLRVRDESTSATHESLVERFRYGEGVTNAKRLNLRGKVRQHYDGSGIAQTDEFDLSEQPRVSRRRLASDIEAPVLDWNGVQLANIHVQNAARFESEVFTQRSDYDALGRPTRMYNWHVESPNGSGHSDRVAVYLPSYNKRGLLATETLLVRARKTPTGHEVDPAVTRGQVAITRVEYDAKGQKTRLDCGNGTITKYDYDPKTFRLRVLRTTRPGYNPRFPAKRGQLADARVLQHLFYSHDASGNITEIQDDAWAPAFFDNQRVEAASRYVYDSIDRLVEATGREHGRVSGAPPQLPSGPLSVPGFPVTSPAALRNYTERYRYDAVGNILTMRHIAGSLGSWTRTYDYATANNQLTGTNTDNPAQAVTYGYDSHGSMSNLRSAPARFDLRWDWNDMIHTIDLGGGGRAWYQYGADKQRCRKRIDRQNGTSGYWERIYLPGFELYRRFSSMGSGTLVELIETHHLLEREQRTLLVDDVIRAGGANHPRPDGIAVQEQILFRYQYVNLLGSACLELDSATAVISYEEYHPYGSTAYHAAEGAVEAPPKRYRYAGLERDEESGLSYHKARCYAPLTARWCSCDPASLADGLNLYIYGRGNPVCLRDVHGTQAGTAASASGLQERALSFAGGVYGASLALLGGFSAAFKTGYYAMASNMYFFTGDSIYREQDVKFREGYAALQALANADLGDVAKRYITTRGDAITAAAAQGDAFTASTVAGQTLMDLWLLARAAQSSTPRVKLSFDPGGVVNAPGGITIPVPGGVSASLLGPKDLAEGLYVAASTAETASQQEGEAKGKQGPEEPDWKKPHTSGKTGEEATEQFLLLRGDEIVGRHIMFRIGSFEFTVDFLTRRLRAAIPREIFTGVESKAGAGKLSGPQRAVASGTGSVRAVAFGKAAEEAGIAGRAITFEYQQVQSIGGEVNSVVVLADKPVVLWCE